MRRQWKMKGRRILAAALIGVLTLPHTGFASGGTAEGTFSFQDADKMTDEVIRRHTNDAEASGNDAEADGAVLDDAEAGGNDAEADPSEDAGDWGTRPATPSAALMAVRSVSSLGDLWDDWNGDFSFLDGSSGKGTKEKPYQIRTKSQLMGLSQLAAMGMRVNPGEGQMIGNYEGAYFELAGSIDLGGMNWNPIGFYRDSSELSGDIMHPFCGHFDGNGKTVSNFRLGSSDWNNVGLFGELKNASVENLTVRPNKTVRGAKNVSILAGSSVDSTIRNCSVAGDISAGGNAGGICAVVNGSSSADSVIENCEANVTIDAAGSAGMCVGGIAGKAAGTSIVDCRVTTGDNSTARIQSRGIAGGIAGFQNDTDIYNVFVSGTVGGAGTQAAGGITGRYGSGHLKVARFEGKIGDSGLGSPGHRGSFIGTREEGDYFRYGGDVAYLFAGSEAGLMYGVCGSGIPDDNIYTYAAHIGYSHSGVSGRGGDLHYSLAQGGVSKNVTDTYFYEELENGILSIMDGDNGGADARDLGYELDHFAPNDAGQPARGYLITVPQIDTVSSGTNYYDVAVLEARGKSSYSRMIDKRHRGAVAAGKTVIVTTSPRNTEDVKFQMEGVPVYTKGGSDHDTAYVAGGEYTFTMPPENTEVKAVYKKVAVKVSVLPDSYNIRVVEERTGDRKNPVKTTKVLNHEGKLIATYINGALEQGTRVQPIFIRSVVDVNNDVADSSVKWSVDDPALILLANNDDEDDGGYTGKSASVSVNLGAPFFADTIRKLEKDQADRNYQYPIPDTIYGSGHQSGGVAILTAATRPSASFEKRPCTANCRLNVTFQIQDQTFVANESAFLDKASMEFTVTRTLTGDRKAPEETIKVTPPQSLTAGFHPDFFDRKDLTWTTDGDSLLTVDGEGKSASVSARPDAKWIQDMIAGDAGIHANDPYAVLSASGRRTAMVTVIADDMLGNRQTADCRATIRFVTDDQTKICVEGVKSSPEELTFSLICTKSGPKSNPEVIWKGTDAKKVAAEISPARAFDKTVSWLTSDDAVKVDGDGTVTVNTGAKWIAEADKSAPHTGEHTSTVTVVTGDGNFKAAATIKLLYQLTDNTYHVSGGSSHSSGGSGGGGAGGGGGGFSSGVGPTGGVGPGAFGTTAPAGSVTGTWVNTADGLWAFTANGRTYTSEWAYIHNPYTEKDQSSADWFRFDETGHMVTGWFSDTDGNLYYLSPVSDGTLGHMVAGWQWISGADGLKRAYFFNPVPDGTRGALCRSCVTPDGLTVNESGQWAVNGIAVAKE